MIKEQAIQFANCLKNNYTIDFNDMADFCDMAIKALEQQTSDYCGDINNVIATISQHHLLIHNLYKGAKALPPVTPTQSWIPVSERLPKESDGAVLITVNGEVNTGRYSEFSNTWYKGDMRGVGGDDPIAWQPLPQPYEEKSGSENE